MIRIDRPPDAPGSLKEKGQMREDQACAAFDCDPDKYVSGEWKFLFDEGIYTAVPVKNCLLKIHHGKCCYCEKKFPARELDVEHFRPKGSVQQDVGQNPEKPGYFWLAYKWENLLLACQACNRRSKQTLFPLANPTERAKPHLRDVGNEEPLFIDPTRADPRKNIQFVDDAPTGLTREGKETINGLKLRRPSLREDRLVRLREIQRQRDIIQLAAEDPANEDFQAVAIQAREYVESAVKSDAEFSSMAIDALRNPKNIHKNLVQ